MEQTKRPGRVTLRLAIATTTPGAVLMTGLAPALLGLLLAVEERGTVDALSAILLLLIPSLMNAAVASLNDYFDYVSGNDTPENVVSEADGPLAWNRVANPKPVLRFALGLLGLAALLGAAVIWRCGWLPAYIGAAGAAIGLSYSGLGRGSSYLPIGEPLAGFTLGGLVPLGVYAALCGKLDWLLLWKALPMMLIVSEFMLSNNTCDMERDSAAGRRTLPILIGRRRAEALARGSIVFWLAQLLSVLAVWYPLGLLLMLPVLLLCRKGIRGAMFLPRTHETKTPSTAALALLALGVSAGYPAALGLHLLLRALFRQV
ncbi:MAG: prenyltransferase [Oscillospiraceae bacterium]|nr:prenyltransferase [Oscillospiraceae bacterium]MBQ9411863.1 prenyltransferase [Oscillospiraceae bacterium]